MQASYIKNRGLLTFHALHLPWLEKNVDVKKKCLVKLQQNANEKLHSESDSNYICISINLNRP